MDAVLHIAAMPFPTHQGTQGAIRAMLEASCERTTHLLTYARGAYELEASFEVHRVGDWPTDRSLRSGPSAKKVALDVRLAAALRNLEQHLRPKLVIAHHVEAMAATAVLSRTPSVFVAHTSLERELPVYGWGIAKNVLSRLGRGVDAKLLPRAKAAAAVSPKLARDLSRAAQRDVAYLPIPWSANPDSRASTSDCTVPRGPHACFSQSAPRLLYVGNLDAYQGWQDTMVALAHVRHDHPGATLVVATASHPDPATKLAGELGVASSVRLVKLTDERLRRQLYANADVVLVPRRIAGGVSVKLLDALTRGVPAVACELACGDLPLTDSAVVVKPGASAIAAGVRCLLANPGLWRQLVNAGPRYIERHHSAEAFLEVMGELERRALS